MTELEACVLTLVCRDGPITAYQVRMEFERSHAQRWRMSTGSIYPLIRRLSAQGLIRSKETSSDARGTKRLTATPAGRRQAEAWLLEIPPWLGDIGEDAIRTRVHFLSILAPAKRAVVIEDLRGVTSSSIADIEGQIELLDHDHVDWIVFQGIRAMLAARARWLTKVAEFFSARR